MAGFLKKSKNYLIINKKPGFDIFRIPVFY
jgi:hypothetical protein